MLNSNELFSVFEFLPATFFKTRQTDCQYKLTLVLREKGAGFLFPDFSGFPCFQDRIMLNIKANYFQSKHSGYDLLKYYTVLK